MFTCTGLEDHENHRDQTVTTCRRWMTLQSEQGRRKRGERRGEEGGSQFAAGFSPPTPSCSVPLSTHGKQEMPWRNKWTTHAQRFLPVISKLMTKRTDDPSARDLIDGTRFPPERPPSSQAVDSSRDSMTLSKRRKTLALLLLALLFSLMFATFLFSFPLQDHFFKHAFHLAASSKVPPCACRRCMTEANNDTWFAKRFNQSIHPLMTRDNSVLSEETFKWWQLLQQEKRPADFDEVVDELFRLIPDHVLYADAGPERCRTCAVVGNSGNLRGSRYGHLIDSSHFVLRMNQAVTDGFEEDVGSRTTHRLMYPESATDLDNATILVFIPFKTLDLQWMISALTTGTINYTYAPVMPRIKANKDKVVIYNPTFFKYVCESWLEGHGGYPSTGFLSLLFAIHICDKVNVFGFGADQRGNWHHYWEKNLQDGAFRYTGIHDGDFEHYVTNILADKHKIQMFRGS
ncbi:CMP-N-acetylneuraminate-beta-galactosamide-alpha-2,3-sialyltransferase 1-like isoform X2 [Stigmatopora argus]